MINEVKNFSELYHFSVTLKLKRSCLKNWRLGADKENY